MKRFLSFLLILTLVLSLGVFASAEEPDWLAAYDAIRREKQAELSKQEAEYGPSFGTGYVLYDIDKDGVPELITKMGTCEADFHGEIYRFVDGQAACRVDNIHLGHSSLYTDPGENGLIVMYGHMGYAEADRLVLGEKDYTMETLYEDNLNERLEQDPNAEYLYPGAYVPGAAYLTLSSMELRLPLTHYEEIQNCLEGRFPGTVACGDAPQGDPAFFEKLIRENREVIAVTADGFTNSPGRIPFQELLKQNCVADWMDADLQILSTQLADLNGDGQPECIVDLSQGESRERMRFFLSEQDGTVYAYLQNYAPETLTVDQNGNLLAGSVYYAGLSRLVFDGEEAMLLTLPTAFFAA